MTPNELKAALDRLSDAEFATFRRSMGGDYPTRQGYVDSFVHTPDLERRLCQLLGLPTEAEKSTTASLTSASAAAETVQLARRANFIAWLALAISLVAFILTFTKG